MAQAIGEMSNLRWLRLTHGIRLRDLADATGIDFALISKYENGLRPMSDERFNLLRDGIEAAKAIKALDERFKDGQRQHHFTAYADNLL